MPIRKGHGKGAGTPHVEVLPAAKLPDAVPAAHGPIARRSDGRIADSAAAKELGRRGGSAKQRRLRLLTKLGLGEIYKESSFRSFCDDAEEFAKVHLEELAKMAGGSVGTGPSSFVATAALQLAASRWAFTKAARLEDAALHKLASSLGNDSRQNVLAAYELAVREAVGKKGGSLAPRTLPPWMQD